MATELGIEGRLEAMVLTRLVHPERDDLPTEAASALLKLEFDQDDLDRLHHLVTKNKDDALAPAERSELQSYLRVSGFLDLMDANARHPLKRKS